MPESSGKEIPDTLAGIDWTRWRPVEVATLCFVVQDGRILLIHKKRGLGAGKMNGPGGRLEAGETPLQGAIREVEEELCITPTALREAGQLFFQFTNGHSIHGYVFTAEGFTGTPTETDEALPEWFREEDIPFDRMWADDRHWFPMMLEGTYFKGRFLFDDDRLLDMHINTGSC